MCFSPFASFSVAGLLSIIGIKTIKEIPSKKFIPFALIPLFFAMQQIFEGALWMILLNNPESLWRFFTGYGFLFFAFIMWPVWAPFSLLLIEQKKKYQKTLTLVLIIGSIISLYFLYHILSQSLFINLQEGHIYYQLNVPPYLYELMQIGYMACTVTPFFISSVPRMPLIGTLLTIASYITYRVWYMYFISIWCFFAAIISLAALYTLRKAKK